MKRIVAVVVMAWLATGCLDAIPCLATTPCAEGVCSAEGVCVRGGATDGSSGGQDGGADAGMDAGRDAGPDAGADAGLDAGVDAGFDAGLDAGFDAGPVASCTAACPDWQRCEADFDGGSCHNIALAILAPDAGLEFPAGAHVSLLVRASLRDGSALDGIAVPLDAGFSASSSVIAETPENVTLPSALGLYTLTVGWPGYVSASVDVQTVTAPTAHAEWEQCTP